MPAEVLHYCDGKVKPLQNYFLDKFKLSLKGFLVFNSFLLINENDIFR